MATPAVLYGPNGLPLTTFDLGSQGNFLAAITPCEVYGVFKAVKIASGDGTQTTTLVAALGDNGIRLTDLVVSFEKKTSAEVTLQFNDGTNSEIIWFADMQDAPVFFGTSFAGRWQGWQGAYIEYIVAGAGLDGSIGLGYVRCAKENTLNYSQWNVAR